MRPFRAAGLLLLGIAAACSAYAGAEAPAPATDPDAGTTSDGGGADVDGGTNASDATDGPTRFCAAQAPGTVACADFDLGSTTSNGWASNVTQGNEINLVASVRSAPYALETRQVATDGGADNVAGIAHVFTIPTTATRIKLAADVRFTKHDTPVSPAGVMTLLTSTGMFIRCDESLSPVASQRTVYLVVSADGGVGGANASAVVPTDWARYTIDIQRASGGGTTAAVERDGVLVGPVVPIPDLPSGTAFVAVGAGTPPGSVNGETVHQFDNLLVTVE